jgi:hypothetical protein
MQLLGDFRAGLGDGGPVGVVDDGDQEQHRDHHSAHIGLLFGRDGLVCFQARWFSFVH